MCLTNCRVFLLWQWAMVAWFPSRTGIYIPCPLSLLFRLSVRAPCPGVYLQSEIAKQERIQPNCPVLAQQTKRVSLGEVLQLYFSDYEGQPPLPRMPLFPAMWNSIVKISSFCTELWHRSSQNVNLFALTKCAEGAGVGVVKITADAVKPHMTAVMYWPDSCQFFVLSICRKWAAGFHICSWGKSLA